MDINTIYVFTFVEKSILYRISLKEMFVVADCAFSAFERIFHKNNLVSGERRQFGRNSLSALHTNSVKWNDMLHSKSRYFVGEKWTISIGQMSLSFQLLKNCISSEMEAIPNLCSVLSLGWRVRTDYKENVGANGWQNDITCSVCIKM